MVEERRVIRVITYAADGEVESTRTCNHKERGSKDWLISHIHWALYNGRAVRIEPCDASSPSTSSPSPSSSPQ